MVRTCYLYMIPHAFESSVVMARCVRCRIMVFMLNQADTFPGWHDLSTAVGIVWPGSLFRRPQLVRIFFEKVLDRKLLKI